MVRTVGLIYRKDKPLSRAALGFIEVVAEFARAVQPQAELAPPLTPRKASESLLKQAANPSHRGPGCDRSAIVEAFVSPPDACKPIGARLERFVTCEGDNWSARTPELIRFGKSLDPVAHGSAVVLPRLAA